MTVDVAAAQLPEDLKAMQLLRQSEVLALVGLARTQVYQLRRAGKFPAPVFLMGNANMKRWKRSDVVAWMEANSLAAPVAPPRMDRRRRRAEPPEPARA